MQALGLVWGAVDSQAPDFQEHRTELGAPRHHGARLLHAVWQERTAKGGFVVGRDVPSRILSNVLRNIVVLEPVEGGRDFKVRIAGTAFVRRFGHDITGERMSTLLAADLFQQEREMLCDAIESGRPHFLDIEQVQGERLLAKCDLVLLPVLAPDGVTKWAIKGLFFEDWTN